MDRAVAISAGSNNSLGLREDGTVLAYGIWGEAGPPVESGVKAISASNRDVFLHLDGTVTVYPAPAPESGPPAGDYLAVSAGYDYGLGIVRLEERRPIRPVLGSSRVQPDVDCNPSGTAEAFRVTATRTRQISTTGVYLDARSEATEIIVGVYDDVDGEPGTLLSEGRSSELRAGAWNSISIDAVDVEAGDRYWLALLSPTGSGVVKFRDARSRWGGPTRVSAEDDLSSATGLPESWTTGARHGRTIVSLYAN